MTQWETNEHNRDHCKHIAETLEAYAYGEIVRCPECGAEVKPEETNGRHRCPECGAAFDIDDAETCNVYDFLNDIYDIEYRIGSDLEYRSGRVMVAFGGPDIYLDTASRAVELCWWDDRASYSIHYDACLELDDALEELYKCR